MNLPTIVTILKTSKQINNDRARATTIYSPTLSRGKCKMRMEGDEESEKLL